MGISPVDVKPLGGIRYEVQGWVITEDQDELPSFEQVSYQPGNAYRPEIAVCSCERNSLLDYCSHVLSVIEFRRRGEG